MTLATMIVLGYYLGLLGMDLNVDVGGTEGPTQLHRGLHLCHSN